MKVPLPFVLLLVMAALVFYGLLSRPAQAAPAEAVPQCEKVAETPNLAIYLCQPENGPPFYINSYGFLAIIE